MKTIVGLLAALTLAACGSAQSSSGTAAVKPQNQAASPAALSSSAPARATGSAATTSPVAVPNSQAGTAASPGIQCQAGRENPRGPLCPTPAPTPPTQPARAAHIAFCGTQPVAQGPQPAMSQNAVCGTGFSPAEVIALVLSGRRGTASWTVAANTSGSFTFTLPPAACGYVPGSLVARGNRGHVSNFLTVTFLTCHPTL